jgi:hypothetical protein
MKLVVNLLIKIFYKMELSSELLKTIDPVYYKNQFIATQFDENLA